MRILFATDGSFYSDMAADFLLSLPFGPDDDMTVLHVLKEYLLPDAIDPHRDFRKAGRRGAEALVEEYVARFKAGGISARAVIREGEPWREVVECASEEGADLIVLGHKGLAGLEHYLLGGVASQVLRHTEVSVFIAREPPPAGRPLRVLFCTDGSRSSVYARELLTALPFDRGAEVHVLSVVDMEVTSLPEKYYPEEDMSRMMAELREYNLELAQKAVGEDSDYLAGHFEKTDEHIKFGVPEAEILKLAEELGTDLLVMGSKKLKGIKGFLLGSVSLRVVRHAMCSVLVAMSPG